MNCKLLALLSVVIAMTGCQMFSQIKTASSDYVEPSSGPTTRVRFATNANIIVIPDKSCIDWSAPRAGVVVSNRAFIAGKPSAIGKNLNMPGEKPKGIAYAEVKVSAAKPLTVMFDSVDSEADWHYTCTAQFTFLPKENEDYQVVVLGPRGCKIEVVSLTNPTARVSGFRAEACK
jgi:hypothetical protein